MRNFKKFLTLVLAVMMVVSSVAFSTSAATTKFTDIDTDNEKLVEAVDLLSYMGVAKGKTDTTFGADENVTREQFALFIYRLLKGGKEAPKQANNSTSFTDLEDPTYFYAIAWAVSQGIVNGRTATTFDPKAPITLQEAYAMVVRALEWETKEETLAYPYEHIEVAEQKGVKLDAGLDSSIGYTDTLTRADMAIILYNAFFAETGNEEVKTQLVDDGNDGYYIQQYTTHPRLCEVQFDVVEVEYQAMATPNYQFGGAEATADLGYDAVYLQQVTDDAGNALVGGVAEAIYLTAEDLGIDAKALDAYFLGVFTIFATVDGDGDIEKILFADCNMTKKTVTEIKLGEVSANKYFEDTNAKLLSGKLTAGTSVMYVYNAPYSYANGTYPAGADAEQKYATRNSDNLQSITLTKNGDVFEAVIAPIVSDVDLENDPDFTTQATELAEAFAEAYNGGYYEADLYDVDGNGLYDFIYYKPYTFFQVDADEDVTFAESDFDAEIPVIYTSDATVIGKKYDNEDYVIGYFDADLAIVKVVAVVDPVKATVAKFDADEGTVKLATGKTFDAVSAWKLYADAPVYDVEDYVATLIDESLYFTHAIKDEPRKNYFVYDGVIIAATEIAASQNSATESLFTAEIAVPLSTDVQTTFDPEAGTFTKYANVWIEGTNKWVRVDGVATVEEFIGIPCTYKLNDNNNYEFKAIDIQTDTSVLTSRDEGKQVYITDDINGFTKIAGNRYQLGEYKVELEDFTRVIIRTGTNAWKVYSAEDFARSLKGSISFTNVHMVLTNNANSKTRDDLVFLYAEGDDIWAGAAADPVDSALKMINAYDVVKNADGKWDISYTLIDPVKGAIINNITKGQYSTAASAAADAEPAGTMVTTRGTTIETYGDSIADYEKAEILTWIGGVDAVEGRIKVAPYVDEYVTDGECGKCLETYVNGEYRMEIIDFIDGSVITTDSEGYIKYSDKTVVSVITGDTYEDLWEGKISLAEVADLEDADKDLLGYNGSAYAKCVKAYVSVDADGVADLIIVAVYGEDDEALIAGKDCGKTHL